MRQFYSIMNKSNHIELKTPANMTHLPPFKFYVGRTGNNNIVVKQNLKSRWWWAQGDSAHFDDVNFIWTSWKKNHIVDQIYPQYDIGDKYSTEFTTTETDSYSLKMYNRLEDNFHLTNKKALFWNLKAYYQYINKNPYDVLPLTFHIYST